jgi:hypothetical protein
MKVETGDHFSESLLYSSEYCKVARELQNQPRVKTLYQLGLNSEKKRYRASELFEKYLCPSQSAEGPW